jgi:eukaryotic translation initiation factor 2C
VNVGTKDNPSYVPPEVCMVVPGQPSNAKLSPDQTAQMIKFAVRKPNENAEFIASAGYKLLGFNGESPALVSISLSNFRRHCLLLRFTNI